MSTANGIEPRLLLVDDDPTSLGFMRAVLESLPARVDTAGSVAAAMTACIGVQHDLLLLDANLPDGSGSDLLRLVRSSHAPGDHAPALAHTADDSPELHSRLLADGFVGVLVKPLAATELLEAARRCLGQHPVLPPSRVAEPAAMPPLWDHVAALAAVNGNESDAVALRGIFLVDLDRQHAAIMSLLAAGDFEAARQHLHQLKASSGFVGARRLHAAAAALDREPAARALAQYFETVLVETRSVARASPAWPRAGQPTQHFP